MQTCTRPILPADVAVAVSAPPSTRVSVVIPCLDEAETIAECVTTARAVLDENDLDGEVIVVDNGSTDGSGDLARAAGALVVEEPRRGLRQRIPRRTRQPPAATTSSWSTPTSRTTSARSRAS